ncbi:hypothetical protein KUTeg_002374 [Tegillarca granosa]|uniref:C-type lectin domain-containing protein n=1 Tax=Tegillarca granosa TaxID=220873 RepID=A0ABQ9FXQ9_TEGGR|nr:hypothetical protein KUTeg_002374 [Tegillarca granosa]
MSNHLRSHECPSNIPTSLLVSIYERTCLQIVTESKSWTEARKHCLRFGGDLIRVNSVDKQNFIMLQLRRNDPNRVWIGASYHVVESKWKWVTGDGVQKHYQNWKPGQGPRHKGQVHSTSMSNDCTLMDYNEGGQWEARPCNLTYFEYNFICEYGRYNSIIVSAHITLTTVRTQEPKPSLQSQPFMSSKLTSRRSKLKSTSQTIQYSSTSATEYPLSSLKHAIETISTTKEMLPENVSARTAASWKISTQNSELTKTNTTASKNVSSKAGTYANSDSRSIRLSERIIANIHTYIPVIPAVLSQEYYLAYLWCRCCIDIMSNRSQKFYIFSKFSVYVNKAASVDLTVMIPSVRKPYTV